MPVTATPVFVQTPKLGLAELNNGSGTSLVTVLTGGSNGSKIVGLTVTSTDTSDRTLQLYVTRGGTDYLLATKVIPDLSGTNGTDATVDFLGDTTLWPGLPKDNDGQRFIHLTDASDVLKAKVTGTITATKVIHVGVVYGDF